MIDRQGDNIVIECDTCEATFDAGAEGLGPLSNEFGIVWKAAKRDGWKTRKIGEDWLHFCPKAGCKP